MIWSCYDEGRQSEDHDEGLLILANVSPFEWTGINQEFENKMNKLKKMVRDLIGEGIYEKIKSFPKGFGPICEVEMGCSELKCNLKKSIVGLNFHVILILVGFLIINAVLILRCIFLK